MKSISDMSIGELAAFLCNHLTSNGINCVLTGGACISIYSENKYQSEDLDFIDQSFVPRKKIRLIMEQIGFTEKNRYFIHPETRWFVEFPTGPLAVGNEPIRDIIEIEYSTGTLKIISPTESVKDRLAAYFFWDDLQSLDQAKLVVETNEINFIEIKRWSIEQGCPDKYDNFIHSLNNKPI